MRIYLVRHGQKQKGQNRFRNGYYDPDLTSTGEYQADLTGRRLARLPLQVIFSSNLNRTMQTAEIINRYLCLPFLERNEIREINMGNWEGVPFEKLAEEKDAYYLAWREHKKDLPYPNGESGADVLHRIMPFLGEIHQQGLENILLVTHGGIVRVLVSACIGLEMQKRFRLRVDNCSLALIEYAEPNNMRLVCLNDTSHLPLQDKTE